MEHPCYKCDQILEEGRAFCPHCGAPQIRVLVSEAVQAAPPVESTDSATGERPASETVPVLAVPMRWSQALKPCGFAAVIGTLLMALGLTPAVAMFSAGFLSVLLYRQIRPGIAIGAATGARLGALGGLLWFGIAAVLAAAAATVPDLRAKIQEQVIDNATKWAAAHPPDPRIQAGLDQLKTPEGFVMMLIIGGVMMLVISVVLSTVGGSLAGALFGRRDPT